MSDDILILTDEKNFLKLDKKMALKLELKLNVSDFIKKWENIGDILYDFHVGKNNKNLFKISNFKYNILLSYIRE